MTSKEKNRQFQYVIRMRMMFAEMVVKNKDNNFSAFSIGNMKKELKELKNKYPYLWRTRNKQYHIEHVKNDYHIKDGIIKLPTTGQHKFVPRIIK